MPQQAPLPSSSRSAVIHCRRFEGKVALVTGGGTGIGAGAARRLAAEGARVVVTGRRAAPIEEVARDIGGLTVAGDVSDPNHVAEAVRRTVEHFGGLDVLVANAGAPVFGSIEEVSMEQWRSAFATNLDGAMLFARAAVPEFRKRGGGSIVLIASMAALTGAPHGAPYITSKAAMLGLNRSIAFDYGPDNVRCNVVCPGWVRTEMADNGLAALAAARGMTPAELVERTCRLMPLRKMGNSDELGAAVAFLASSDASFITGTVMIVDGGAAIVDAGIVAAL